jgi:uncharacterized protein YcbX
MPTLAGIFTYPIKSCAAIGHPTVDLDTFGLQGDRRWMIVDAEGVLITQRETPALALVHPTLDAQSLRLTAPSMPEITIPLTQEARPLRTVKVWEDTVIADDEGDPVGTWLSDYLHQTARLVKVGAKFDRPVSTKYATRPTQTTFTDGFPILVVTTASLDDLNQRLLERGADPIPMSRFRPNLIIEGGTPFAEDTWHTIEIGSVTLDIIKPCARCVMTTVDQATGTVPDHTEPLATLNTFRKQDGKVMFAQNAIHRAPGQLSIGDSVIIREFAHAE